MKRCAWILMLIGVIILQSLVVPRWFSYSWAPHLLLDIALVVTILKGRSHGMMLAVIGGIVQDVMIGNYFGLHVVSYAAVSYMLGSMQGIVMTTYIWNHGIPSIGIDALVGIVVHKLVWRWEEKDEYMW